MKRLRLWFFSARLALALSPTFLRTILVIIKPYTSSLAATTLLVIYLCLLLIPNAPLATTTPPLAQETPIADALHTTTLKLLPQEKLDELRTHWLETLTVQPTHRDALLNLALLEEAVGSTQSAQEYFDQAHQLDPNNKVFKK